ncbi:MAG: efflux RND transporter permease subunit [bacterium]
MKSFTDIFIKHPVLAIVVNVAILLIGLRASMSLPIQQFPKIESSSIVITTVYIGASAENVRGFLTTPIERAVSAISGIDYIESSSTAGVSVVTIKLKLNHPRTEALAEVNARLQQIRGELPAEAEPPTIEVQRADRPYATFYIAFNSDTMSIPALTDWLTRQIQPQFATLANVQRVGIEGGRTLAMRIWIDPQRLSALGLTAGDVSEALRRNNFLAAVGRTKGELTQIDLLANTDLRTVAEFEQLIVEQRDGATIRLGDVARVELGTDEAMMIAKYAGKESVYLSVWPLPGVNEIAISNAIKAKMDQLRPTLPPGTNMDFAWNATVFMEASLKEISKTLAETVLIVGLVVFLFMGSIRTALVPLIAIPISLVGAGIFMSLMGFSLNLLTILAIVLAVGLVVDDAIVVVENVQRHVREGKSRTDAALISARELVGPIIAMTITLAVVYAPIGFQGGLTGVLFREFAFTLAAAVIVSGIVAITLSPVMSAAMVRQGGKQSAFTHVVNRAFDRVRDVYSQMLESALRMRWAIVAASLLVTLAAVPLYMFSGRELAPVEDEKHVFVILQGAPDSTLQESSKQASTVAEMFKQIPESKGVWSIVSPGSGFGGMIATDWNDRKRNTKQIAGEAFGMLSVLPGVQAFPVTPPPLPGAEQFDVELVLKSQLPPEQLLGVAQQVLAEGNAAGIFMYVDTDLKIDLPQARVIVDRDKVADLGMDLAGVGQELGVLLGGGYTNRFNYFDRSYKVIPQLGDENRRGPTALLDLKVRSPSGELIPVSSFASIQTTAAPRTLNKFQQQNAVRINAGVVPGVTKEFALTKLEEIARKAGGGDITLDHAGESRQIRKEGSAMASSLGLAIALIYLVLAAQFRSFRDPLIVLLGSVPLAISGALVFSFLDFTTINIYSQVGLVTLVGLIAKNGILIVEFANVLQERGMDKLTAIGQASATRLRPVLMTSFATVFGHLPLVFVTGPGAAARNSIGTVLVAGMTIGTIFTLFVIPVMYLLIAAKHKQAPEQAEEPTGAKGPTPLPA